MKKYTLPVLITLIALAISGYSIILYKTQYKSYKDVPYHPDYNDMIFYKLKGLSFYYMEALENEYKVWKRAKDKKITREYIEQITSIKKDNLTNKYCDLMETKYSEDNVIACIETYYDELELYQLLRVEYDDIFQIYKYGNNNTIRQKAITILYLIDDLKHLTINSNNKPEKFYEKYKAIVNEIENEFEDMYKKV